MDRSYSGVGRFRGPQGLRDQQHNICLWMDHTDKNAMSLRLLTRQLTSLARPSPLSSSPRRPRRGRPSRSPLHPQSTALLPVPSSCSFLRWMRSSTCRCPEPKQPALLRRRAHLHLKKNASAGFVERVLFTCWCPFPEEWWCSCSKHRHVEERARRSQQMQE